MTNRLIPILLSTLIFTGGVFGQVRVMPGEVKDTRRTDGFFNKLEVEMKVLGDVLSGAKGIRVRITKAVDETGKDLLPEKKGDDEFKEISSSGSETAKVDLELKNPARKAMAVQEISGTLELFVPSRDANATILIPSLTSAVGHAFEHAGLKAAGIDVSIWNKQQYETRRKSEEERLKKAYEERKKKAAEPGGSAEDFGDALAQGLMKVFGGLFNAMTEMGENGLAIQVTDPKKLLIGIEFEDANGKTIDHRGQTTLGGEERTMLFDFEEKLPETARVKLHLLTSKSVVSFPFKLVNVPLP